MKRATSNKFISIFTFLLMISFIANAQTQTLTPEEKKAAEIKKLETSLNAAKAKVDQAQRKIEVADSLVTAGEAMLEESRTEDKAITSERKALEKEYSANRKPIEKQTTSKDKEEATAAKAELKTLDTQYKADVKALDARYKESTKKFTTANSNIDKGKMNKKTAKDALNLAETNLETAQAKYDAATAPPEEKKKK
jgi:chromosome segregation ATPase